jgi:hypothetical protein
MPGSCTKLTGTASRSREGKRISSFFAVTRARGRPGYFLLVVLHLQPPIPASVDLEPASDALADSLRDQARPQAYVVDDTCR